MVYNTILDAVGNTPMVRLNRIPEEGSAEILVKVEALNVGGSIKTRTALNMIEQAEKEVQDLHKRTSEGLKTARLNGKQVGRQKGTTFQTKKSEKAKQIILKHSIDFGGTLTDKECMQMIGGIARNSYYKYKRELKS